MDDVTVLHGDTDECPRGIGTFGSRSAPVGGSAIFNNAETVRERARELAAHLLEAAVEDIRFEAGQYFVAGSPARAVGWSEIAAYAYAPDAPEDAAGALTADVDFKPPAETFPFGTHLCAVEIDPDTGAVEIRRYISVDDCGRVINPLLAEGQVHGGLAQGIAQALYEEAVYDADGNFLTPSLLEYAVPRADMLPFLRTAPNGHADPREPARSQGHRRGGDHRLDAGRRQRRDGRAPPLRRGTPRHPADPGKGLARDAGGERTGQRTNKGRDVEFMTLGEQKNMKWKLAVLKVLQEANKPLHYQEILRAIKERQLRPITGNTPERTVYVNLLDLQDAGNVRKTDPGVFEVVLDSDSDEESPRADEERPKPSIVRFPHGRYWRVDSVDWSKGPQKGRLLGQLRGADPISNSVRDFANDPGLYVLHHTHAPMGILYVGMTEKSPLRTSEESSWRPMRRSLGLFFVVQCLGHDRRGT